MEITVTKKFKIGNFPVPSSIRRDGHGEMDSIPLSDLDEMTLDALCRQFYKDVFKSAGKTPPPSAG